MSNRYSTYGNLAIKKRPKSTLRKKREREKRLKRKHKRNQPMSFLQVLFLSLCTVILANSLIKLLSLQSSIQQRMNHINLLENQILNLRSINNEKEKRLKTQINLEFIKESAINELGMDYAKEDQIIYYKIEHNNFLDQYEDIPK